MLIKVVYMCLGGVRNSCLAFNVVNIQHGHVTWCLFWSRLRQKRLKKVIKSQRRTVRCTQACRNNVGGCDKRARRLGFETTWTFFFPSRKYTRLDFQAREERKSVSVDQNLTFFCWQPKKTGLLKRNWSEVTEVVEFHVRLEIDCWTFHFLKCHPIIHSGLITMAYTWRKDLKNINHLKTA